MSILRISVAVCRIRLGSALAKQQVIMEEILEEYHNIRSHEAIKWKSPGSVHKPPEDHIPKRKHNANFHLIISK